MEISKEFLENLSKLLKTDQLIFMGEGISNTVPVKDMRVFKGDKDELVIVLFSATVK